MGFSSDIVSGIWAREGGKSRAKCYTCGRKFSQGYCLDASHIDHTKDAAYNTCERGVLECLYCHLNRHLEIFFVMGLSNSTKAKRQERNVCQLLIIRILNGEDRHPYPKVARTQEQIAAIKKDLAEFIFGFIECAKVAALEADENALCIETAITWVNELYYMVV